MGTIVDKDALFQIVELAYYIPLVIALMLLGVIWLYSSFENKKRYTRKIQKNTEDCRKKGRVIVKL